MITAPNAPPPDQLYNCDNPAHGYCWHLNDDLSGLTKQERKRFKQLQKQGYLAETLEEVDKELKSINRDLEYKLDEVMELEGEVEDLEEYRELLVKKRMPKPKRERYPYDFVTIPLPLTDPV